MISSVLILYVPGMMQRSEIQSENFGLNSNTLLLLEET